MTWSGIHGTAPATRWQDAYLTGNGRHGALVFGDPYDETVIVTHHRLTLPNGSRSLRAPDVAHRLEQVRDHVLAGRGDEALDCFSDGRPTQWGEPFHPAFALRIRLDPGAGPGDPAEPPGRDRKLAAYRDYRRATDFRTGVVAVQWADAQGAWRRECFVSRADDVIACRLVAPGPQSWANLYLEHDVRLPGAPAGIGIHALGGAGPGTTDGIWADRIWADGTRGVRVTYPMGDGECPGYVGATRVIVTAERVLLLTRVARCDPESPKRGPWSGAAGRDELDRLVAECESELAGLPADFSALLDRHVAVHRPAFERVSLELDVDPADRAASVAELLANSRSAALIERLFAAGRYHLLSASGIRPPRLVGVWQGDWNAAWAGGFTVNANLNLQLAGAVTGDLPEAVFALDRLIHDQVDDWRANARLIFGARGIVSPTHTDGANGASIQLSKAWPLHVWTAGADWLLVTLLDYVAVSGDRGFERDRVVPLLVELARFYEDFLTRRDAHGQVVFVPSYSPENAPLGGVPITVNATMDLAAARHALSAAVDAVEAAAEESRAQVETAAEEPRAQVGAGEVSRWRALLAALPRYRVNPDGALAEWAWPDAVDDYDHRHVSHLYPVWPLHEISVHATPELAAAARRALRLRGHENDSAHGYLHQALVAARLRDPGLVDDMLTEVLSRDFCFDNLMTSHYPGRDVFNSDASCALPGLLLETLVDAEPGRVELLPAVPDSMPAGRLRGARTVAGIRVIDLRWDLRTGAVEAVLEAETARSVLVVCAGDDGRPVDFAAGRPEKLSWCVQRRYRAGVNPDGDAR